MLDWVPLEPLLSSALRPASERLPYWAGYALIFSYNVYRWERQKSYGRKRDVKDREQDRRLDAIQGIQTMEFIKSPNYTKGRLGRSTKKVVVHSMAGYIQPSIDAFLRKEREASSHYLVGHDGRTVQMVDEKDTAWHCGARLAYRFIYPFNNADTIGIETEGGFFGGEDHPFQEEGRKALAELIAGIHRRYEWGEPSSKTVVMHREMPGTATSCPTGVNILEVIQDAQDSYNGHQEAHEQPQVIDVVPPAQKPKYEPFLTDLAPSQSFRQEAKRVQEFLVGKGFMAAPSGPEWGYYGRKTQAAVDRFQKASGIKAGASFYGWWYKQTRDAANKQLT